jgi:hypothetical protein
VVFLHASLSEPAPRPQTKGNRPSKPCPLPGTDAAVADRSLVLLKDHLERLLAVAVAQSKGRT